MLSTKMFGRELLFLLEISWNSVEFSLVMRRSSVVLNVKPLLGLLLKAACMGNTNQNCQ